MKMSLNGLTLLSKWEGEVDHTYRDSAGLQTIGIGHLLTTAEKVNGKVNIAGNQVLIANGITHQQALDLLAQDVKPAEETVNTHITQPMNQNQFDALVSFAFNIGTGGFDSSSVMKDINAKDLKDVPQAFMMWDKITKNGQHVPDEGLIERRKKEISLFNS